VIDTHPVWLPFGASTSVHRMTTAMAQTLDDSQMRAAYHRKRLKRHHSDSSTVVVDELGLQHGKFRADIAVVNGHLAGFEIKSDVDQLTRLSSQVDGYGAVFDRVTLIVTDRHLRRAAELVPNWWGLVTTHRGPRGGIHFTTARQARRNPQVDDFCVAQLLDLGVDGAQLRGNRATLYGLLVSRLNSRELRARVRQKMKTRPDWRCPSRLSQGDGLFPPNATS
jgi:hypothetical protein